MKLTLRRAYEADCGIIHKMQKSAFSKLLEKYQDYDMSPATEPLDVIRTKMAQPQTEYYFIMINDIEIGVMRIVCVNDNTRRISPIFILPEYQNNGYAQLAMLTAERMYPDVNVWTLDTIKEEKKLCHLYEKLGYVPTGKEEKVKDGMTIVFYRKQIG